MLYDQRCSCEHEVCFFLFRQNVRRISIFRYWQSPWNCLSLDGLGLDTKTWFFDSAGILLRFEKIIIRNKRDGKFWARLRNNERYFSSCHERGTKKKFWVPMGNQTSNLRIPRSDALPLSHRDGKFWAR